MKWTFWYPQMSRESNGTQTIIRQPKMVPQLNFLLKLHKWPSFGKKIKGKRDFLPIIIFSLLTPLSLSPAGSFSLLSVGTAVTRLQWPQNVYQNEEDNLRMKLHNYVKVKFKVDCEISRSKVKKIKTKTASVLRVRLSILKTKGTTRFLGSRASKPT